LLLPRLCQRSLIEPWCIHSSDLAYRLSLQSVDPIRPHFRNRWCPEVAKGWRLDPCNWRRSHYCPTNPQVASLKIDMAVVARVTISMELWGMAPPPHGLKLSRRTATWAPSGLMGASATMDLLSEYFTPLIRTEWASFSKRATSTLLPAVPSPPKLSISCSFPLTSSV